MYVGFFFLSIRYCPASRLLFFVKFLLLASSRYKIFLSSFTMPPHAIPFKKAIDNMYELQSEAKQRQAYLLATATTLPSMSSEPSFASQKR